MKEESNPVGRPPLADADKASVQIQLRVQPRRKAAYVKAASKKQMPLAAWMFEQCDRAAGYKA